MDDPDFQERMRKMYVGGGAASTSAIKRAWSYRGPKASDSGDAGLAEASVRRSSQEARRDRGKRAASMGARRCNSTSRTGEEPHILEAALSRYGRTGRGRGAEKKPRNDPEHRYRHGFGRGFSTRPQVFLSLVTAVSRNVSSYFTTRREMPVLQPFR